MMKRISLTCLLMAAMLVACQNTSSASGSSSQTASLVIQNKGSDTLVNLALAWAERYQVEHPEIQISVTGGGSGTGLTSLVNGTVDIANASRQIKKEEISEAQKKGFTPYELIVANDAIAVIVNPSNPISELTLEQVAAIYKGEIKNWSELGGENRPIVRLSRETNSGTHVYFLETVIRLGSKDDKSLFATNTLLLPSSEGIIAEVRDNPNAIGYDGLGYVTHEVKTIALAKTYGEPYYQPSIETVIRGEYPISRHLFMYTHGEPSGVIKTYLEWILSEEAQAIVSQLGFVPVQAGDQ